MTFLSLWNQKPFSTNWFDAEWSQLIDERTFTPPCDIEESENQFLLTLDLPGLKKEEIEVEVTDDTLTVSGFRKEEKKGERFTGKFLRAFSLGESVDVKSIQASYEDGVLKLQIPRLKESKSEVIKIKVEEKLKGSH